MSITDKSSTIPTKVTDLSNSWITMASLPNVSILVGILVLVLLADVSVAKSNESPRFVSECWTAWSRCSGWSRGGTGWLWQSCPQRCRCKGYRSGTCRLSKSNCPIARRPYQCQCYGTRIGSKPFWCGF